MAEKKIKTRIQQKVDTKANWDKATNFIPLKGEYIYYSDTHRVKVGDGVTKLSALSYLADDDTDTHYTTGAYVGATNVKANAATTNGNTYLKIYDDNTKRAEFKIVGSGATKVSSDASGNITISSTDTDSKVTSAANHYTPTADSSAQLSVDASSTTNAAWNSTALVTGVNLQRDAKGHVTGVTVDSIKMPANPNTDTHFTTGFYVGKTGEKSNSATTNGNTYLKLYDNDTKRAQYLINGSGATTVSSNTNGSIEIATQIKKLDTTSSSGLGATSENIAGSGTIYLHKITKTGSYNDLNNKPAIENLVPYTGATKDVDLGKHSLSISNKSDGSGKIKVSSTALSEDDVYCEINSTGVQLIDPGAGTEYCVNYIDSNGLKIYLPSASSTPSGAEVFAVKSDISTLLDKGNSSSLNTQTVYNPVTFKKAITVASVTGSVTTIGSYTFNPLELGYTTSTSEASSALTLKGYIAGLDQQCSTTLEQNGNEFCIDTYNGSTTSILSCDGKWRINGVQVATVNDLEQALPSTQQWKLTSTSGTVTTVNICTK